LKGFSEDWFWKRTAEFGMPKEKTLPILAQERKTHLLPEEFYERDLLNIAPFLFSLIANRDSFGYQYNNEEYNQRERALRILHAVGSKRLLFNPNSVFLQRSRVIPGVKSSFTYFINKILKTRPSGFLPEEEAIKFEQPLAYFHVVRGVPEYAPRNKWENPNIPEYISADQRDGELFFLNQAIGQSIRKIRKNTKYRIAGICVKTANRCLELRDLFATISKTLKDTIGIDGATLLIKDQIEGKPIFFDAFGDERKSEMHRGRVIENPDTIIREILEGKRRSAITPNIYKEKEVQTTMSPEILKDRLNGPPKSVMTVALMTEEGETVGAYSAWRKGLREGSSFGEEEIESMLAFAPALAYAIRRSEIYERNSNHDPLTGLLNRRGINSQLEDLIEKYAGRRTKPFALIFADLNGLKQYNDEWNHQTGDAAIVTAAKAIREQVRPEDIVGRFGGDEYVVILPDADNDVAYKVARRISTHLMEVEFLGAKGMLSMSYGIARFEKGMIAEELIQRADNAAYFSKETGKGHITIYDENIAIYRLMRQLRPKEKEDKRNRAIREGFYQSLSTPQGDISALFVMQMLEFEKTLEPTTWVTPRHDAAIAKLKEISGDDILRGIIVPYLRQLGYIS